MMWYHILSVGHNELKMEIEITTNTLPQQTVIATIAQPLLKLYFLCQMWNLYEAIEACPVEDSQRSH